jgi:hypothetical protein
MNLVGLKTCRRPTTLACRTTTATSVSGCHPWAACSVLFAATWGVLVVRSPAFDPVLGIRHLGARVVDVIGRTAPQCILDELVATVAMLPNPAPRDGDEDRSGSGLRAARSTL